MKNGYFKVALFQNRYRHVKYVYIVHFTLKYIILCYESSVWYLKVLKNHILFLKKKLLIKQNWKR